MSHHLLCCVSAVVKNKTKNLKWCKHGRHIRHVCTLRKKSVYIGRHASLVRLTEAEFYVVQPSVVVCRLIYFDLCLVLCIKPCE